MSLITFVLVAGNTDAAVAAVAGNTDAAVLQAIVMSLITFVLILFCIVGMSFWG